MKGRGGKNKKLGKVKIKGWEGKNKELGKIKRKK